MDVDADGVFAAPAPNRGFGASFACPNPPNSDDPPSFDPPPNTDAVLPKGDGAAAEDVTPPKGETAGVAFDAAAAGAVVDEEKPEPLAPPKLNESPPLRTDDEEAGAAAVVF